MSESKATVKSDPDDDNDVPDEESGDDDMSNHEQQDTAPSLPASSWTETDDTALLLFVQDASKGNAIMQNVDPLEDANEHLWSEIAERFPSKSAINCLQRYAKLRLQELQNKSMRSETATETAGIYSVTAAMNGKRRCEEEEDEEDADTETKRSRVLEEDLLSWSEEEVNTLRNVVSQYVNSKFFTCFSDEIYRTILVCKE
jgi:hypothetical protein